MKNKIKTTKPSTASESRRLNALKKPENIVGIGASAGGLEALEDFFTQVKTPSHMAFVVIQHLDPSHKGIMAELLQRTTQMIVKEASNHMKVERNCVYVIPPNKDLSILHGSLFLFEPVLNSGLRLPIDFFFRSLASDQREHAVAVILSGMGSDGTLGLHAIKQNAGLSLAQSPECAKFSSMPQSAINAELIDIIAPAKELPEHILSGLKHDHRIASKDIEPKLEVKSKSALEQIVIILRERTGNDFSLYKKNTIYRRIERRMNLHQLEDIALYARYLRENPQEQDLLFKELLIGVTNFFRDKDVWAQLKSTSLPALLENYPEGKELRAWVTACSTGEEAYSLAMTMMDVLDEIKPKARFKLQIFATDLDEDAINIARQGFYPASIEADITPTQLARYFIKDDRGYRINKKIRDMIIFAPQNIIMDPPFTKLDIVTCRNLLIYLGPELQKKLIPLFHYALNSHGILMLGNAETIGNFTNLFLALNDSARIFTRIDISKKRMDVDFPSRIFPVISLIHNEPKRTRDMSKDIINLQTQADQILLQNYSPAAVLVNAAGDIMYINGRTGKYLEASAGKANWNIHVMAHEELLMHLNLAMKKAQTQEAPVIIENLMVGKETINLTVQAIAKPKALMGLLMVVFTKVLAPTAQPSKNRGKAAENNQLELQHARDEIEATREQMQAAQEELRSTNEELQSTNEELQSTNEELTTSKEEMQSMNEELQTVNTELQSKVDDLSWVNNDMKNLLNSTEIATVFLDNGLRVRRFTNYATHLFKLIPGDVGRPLSDIVTELDYTSLQKDAREVLDTLIFIEKEITASNDRWFKVRIMPYATQENVIDGVVITFTDISEAKLLESQLREVNPTI
ncbi:PAS domain-containing protein [Colwellia sp. MB02u-18]|uniref:chemotaxis protein CheB n=1 Tax=unclassified Colwellia TaxID=196834 RepID=UPI0015F55F24|nr:MULTISPECIES: chemotaxis protein CheB [unclassified Colwellia]MBA6225239.1 PAS domain-containing protein [Colwellia sp. MB3u-45]MBA6266292.1 PAS domain-containing protein [Colwellia sp. MB3u-43]MBA6322923.1 PAS domain-containing protein [Colwellia sp. MB02u-19]MBA6324669.1 PAS domain-containing protein [Colwellia sp. MB02u-18]MBA6331140.1 PAS domain-containing protein [Colwellia sp. MB02u-12]